jgi:hypothetical protein
MPARAARLEPRMNSSNRHSTCHVDCVNGRCLRECSAGAERPVPSANGGYGKPIDTKVASGRLFASDAMPQILKKSRGAKFFSFCTARNVRFEARLWERTRNSARSENAPRFSRSLGRFRLSSLRARINSGKDSYRY